MHTYIRTQAYIHTVHNTCTYIYYIKIHNSELRGQQMSKLFTCSTNQKHAGAIDKLPYSFGLHLKHFITKARPLNI